MSQGSLKLFNVPGISKVNPFTMFAFNVVVQFLHKGILGKKLVILLL